MVFYVPSYDGVISYAPSSNAVLVKYLKGKGGPASELADRAPALTKLLVTKAWPLGAAGWVVGDNSFAWMEEELSPNV